MTKTKTAEAKKISFASVFLTLILLIFIMVGCHYLDDDKSQAQLQPQTELKKDESQSAENNNSNDFVTAPAQTPIPTPTPTPIITETIIDVPKPIPTAIPIKFHYPIKHYTFYKGLKIEEIKPIIESGTIEKFKLDDGSTLPLGLKLDKSTGIISGIPLKIESPIETEIIAIGKSIPSSEHSPPPLQEKFKITWDVKQLRATDITAGEDYLCGVGKDDNDFSDVGIFCWGNLSILNDPIKEPHFINVIGKESEQFKINKNIMCLKTAGEVNCKKHNEKNFKLFTKLNPELINNFSMGENHACVSDGAKKIKCWGSNSLGQLGLDPRSLNSSETPVDVINSNVDINGVYTGNNHTCILNEESKVYCWGDNKFGQLGSIGSSGSSGSKYGLVLVPGILQGQILTLESNSNYSCVIEDKGKVLCWGEFYFNGSKRVTAPMEISGVSKTVWSLNLGTERSCANDDKTIYCWGSGKNGVESKNSELLRNSLVVIGGYFTCANLGGGADTISCWGLNNLGQLGVSMEIKESLTPLFALPWWINSY
ncbi:MAG: hypothetical protein HQK49_09115 [Oligoflexia bacterium]|nr:hypothetical protein [Oligoflexia bacterium]